MQTCTAGSPSKLVYQIPSYRVNAARASRALRYTLPKTAGPDEVYEQATITLDSWMRAGILTRDVRRALYPYMQTFVHNGRTMHRRGFIALVRLSPFGQGQVVPHEKTYKGP